MAMKDRDGKKAGGRIKTIVLKSCHKRAERKEGGNTNIKAGE